MYNIPRYSSEPYGYSSEPYGTLETPYLESNSHKAKAHLSKHKRHPTKHHKTGKITQKRELLNDLENERRNPGRVAFTACPNTVTSNICCDRYI